MNVEAISNMNERELLEHLRGLQKQLDDLIRTQAKKEVGE